jgi:hypothetical protein
VVAARQFNIESATADRPSRREHAFTAAAGAADRSATADKERAMFGSTTPCRAATPLASKTT